MPHEHKHDIFCAGRAGKLIGFLRRLTQNPYRILKPYLKEGMTLLDFGSGPGFFTVPAAKLVGTSGKIYAVDVQQQMLDMLVKYADKKGVLGNIITINNPEHEIGIELEADIILAIYVAHEVPDRDKLFLSLKKRLKPEGFLLLAEPKHRVTETEFKETLEIAKKNGLEEAGKFKMVESRTAVLKKS
ncbi:MAG: hypothetical protein A2452_07460 [Candidatus Firestonebacteria bacterium RIFOXYC2_FULL_39_67]|nr:MAG: hypothetical protein A2536_01645 [Candidatus Firestonebacteria bacterium RIFOXYD2_FULL_39_29]OGF51886.1 MAG: hypothetical protein A2497_00820 [Candidatus Firestonebacteria bacterium RifOxyC12_full_39_7]OGF55495.1 MAG: hypothetical protein A2452_07460 [Candidatus Firestonebacteria bacterium RIFOXYC2_FULL_39_67]